MRFTHEGRTYVIEFQREYKSLREVGGVSPATAKLSEGPKHTRYPYTTANVLLVKDNGDATGSDGKEQYDLFRTWTVGCWHRELRRFTLEGGRLAALRGVTRGDSLTVGFKRALWDAYHRRGEGVVIEGEKVTVH